MPFDLETLYGLLPAYLRALDRPARDGDAGPLKAFLALLAESVAVLEDDLARLYDDQFIETAAEWAVPYIGQLIGYRRLNDLVTADLAPAVRRALSDRAQVANTLAYRRRKGTLAVIEDLARDVTGWEALAVEFFQRMAVTQHVNHIRPGCSTVDLRGMAARGGAAAPFDTTPRTGEVRPIAKGAGRFNLPNIGIFVWRLRSLPVAGQPAVADPAGPRRYRFSPLSADLPLFAAPEPKRPSHMGEPRNFPLPISRRRLHDDLAGRDGPSRLYGQAGSLALYADGQAVPAAGVLAADLSDDPATGAWAHHPADAFAIDPVLGRITTPANRPAPASLIVAYRTGCPAPVGTVLAQAVLPDAPPGAVTVAVPRNQPDIAAALVALDAGAAQTGEALILESGRYTAPATLHVEAAGWRGVRAAAGERPAVTVNGVWELSGEPDAEVLLEGLLLSGGPLRAPSQANTGGGPAPNRLRTLHLRRCTLVPGLSLAPDGSPRQAGQPSLIIEAPGVTVIIEDCILGGVRAHADARVSVRNSILDAGAQDGVAYAALDGEGPGASLSAENCTFIGRVHADRLDPALNCVFAARFPPGGRWAGVRGQAGPAAPVRAERRQAGCVRGCFVPWGSRTPRRSACHPATATEAGHLWPVFSSLRFGAPGYAQLAATNLPEIWQGAADAATPGVYHDLFEPQRLANLRNRLDEYLRFGLEAGIFTAP